MLLTLLNAYVEVEFWSMQQEMGIYQFGYKQAECLRLVIKTAKLWISFSLYTR